LENSERKIKKFSHTAYVSQENNAVLQYTISELILLSNQVSFTCLVVNDILFSQRDVKGLKKLLNNKSRNCVLNNHAD